MLSSFEFMALSDNYFRSPLNLSFFLSLLGYWNGEEGKTDCWDCSHMDAINSPGIINYSPAC
jgi:hypothetical protein